MSKDKKFTEEEILKDFKENLKSSIIEEQLEYYWIRVYANEEYELESGTVVTMHHLPSDEKLDLIFTNYDKIGKTATQSDELEEYEKEEDKRVLCLLVNINELYKNKEIEYVKKLFRKSKFYEEQLLKRKDLVFKTNFENPTEKKDKQKDELVIKYYDVLF